ncbi:MAG: hypothetical protein MJ252_03770 [archaeon]|nr:hypothetical protein [archaeon]
MYAFGIPSESEDPLNTAFCLEDDEKDSFLSDINGGLDKERKRPIQKKKRFNFEMPVTNDTENFKMVFKMAKDLTNPFKILPNGCQRPTRKNFEANPFSHITNVKEEKGFQKKNVEIQCPFCVRTIGSSTCGHEICEGSLINNF